MSEPAGRGRGRGRGGQPGQAGSGARGRRVCAFFTTPRGCSKGDACTFLHTNDVSGGSTEASELRQHEGGGMSSPQPHGSGGGGGGCGSSGRIRHWEWDGSAEHAKVSAGDLRLADSGCLGPWTLCIMLRQPSIALPAGSCTPTTNSRSVKDMRLLLIMVEAVAKLMHVSQLTHNASNPPACHQQRCSSATPLPVGTAHRTCLPASPATTSLTRTHMRIPN